MAKYLKEDRSERKPVAKKWWFWAIVVYAAVMFIGLIGIALGLDDTEPESVVSAMPATTVPMTESATELTGVKPEAISALPFNVTFSDSFRNDTTGKWRKALIATSETIDKYAVDYYREYFKSEDEVHIIYNFTLNTVNSLTVQAGTLFVNVTEYVDGEEHDAKKACGGLSLGMYHINIETGKTEYIPLSA